MRWFSMRPQICASRPSAVTKKSGARSARRRRWKSSARAAASKAGPRLAEVAGSAKRSERSAEIGRDGIGLTAVAAVFAATTRRDYEPKLRKLRALYKTRRFQG